MVSRDSCRRIMRCLRASSRQVAGPGLLEPPLAASERPVSERARALTRGRGFVRSMAGASLPPGRRKSAGRTGRMGAVLGLPALPSGIVRPRHHPGTRFSLEAPPLQSPVSNRLAAVGGLRDACGSRGGLNSGGFPLGDRALGHRLRALMHSRAPRRATVFGKVQIRLSRLCVSR